MRERYRSQRVIEEAAAEKGLGAMKSKKIISGERAKTMVWNPVVMPAPGTNATASLAILLAL
jgi:hypothetical protein